MIKILIRFAVTLAVAMAAVFILSLLYRVLFGTAPPVLVQMFFIISAWILIMKNFFAPLNEFLDKRKAQKEGSPIKK